MEFVVLGLEISPGTLRAGVLVEPTEMSGNASMQSAYYVVKDLLFEAHLLEVILWLETVLFVDEFPDVGPVIISKGLDVLINIEILSLVVGLILNVPNPSLLAILSLSCPEVLPCSAGFDFFGVGPEFWDVLIIAAADGTALAFAYFFHNT